MNNNKVLFDEHGRCIPIESSHPVHKISRRYFQIKPVDVNYEKIYNKINNFLDTNTSLSLEEFIEKAENIIDKLRRNDRLANILNGVGVPFFIPKRTHGDIGEELEKNYLIGLKKSFKDENPDSDFLNHCSESLSKSIIVDNNSRHNKFIEKIENETVVGYYFPALLEYSFPAVIDAIKVFPDNFYLAGGYDTCAAFIGYPNLLLNKDAYPPLLWMTGLNSDKKNIGYHIEAYGYNLTFNKRPHLGNVAEYWGHSLVII